MRRARSRRTSSRKLSKREVAALDDLARTVVMLRHGAALAVTQGGALAWWGRCAWCRCARWLQWAHIHAKETHRAMRWDPDNALPLCGGCHRFKWHGPDPLAVHRFLVQHLGQHRVTVLALRAGAAVRGAFDASMQRVALEQEARALMERRR